MDFNPHYVKFARGTQEEWDALQSNPQKINNDTLYFIYNNNDLTKGKLYLGQRLIIKNNELKEISINDIGDVFIDDETLAHKQILIYNDISKNWENTSLSNIIHNISELNNDIGYITEQEVNNLISNIDNLRFEVVEEKPLENIQTNVIYLIPKSNPDEHNIYEEWIYSNDNWELIGSINNLDDYMKKIKYIDNYGPATFDLKTDGQFYQKGDIIYNKDNDFFYLKNISEFTYNYDKIYYHYEWQRLGNKIFVSDYDASPIKYYANYTSHRLNFPQTYFKGDIVICPDGKYLCTKMTFDYNFAFEAGSGTLVATYNGRWQKIDDPASQIIKKDIFPPYYFIDSTTEESYNLKEGDIWIYDCNDQIYDQHYGGAHSLDERYIKDNYNRKYYYKLSLANYSKQQIYILKKIKNDNNQNYYSWEKASNELITFSMNGSSNPSIFFPSEVISICGYMPISPYYKSDIIMWNDSGTSIYICYDVSEPIQDIENNGYKYIYSWYKFYDFDDVQPLIKSNLNNYYTKTEIDTLINNKENISNKTILLSSSSTDEQYPSAKAVYDVLAEKANLSDMPTKISDLWNDNDFISRSDISGKEDKSNKVTALMYSSTDQEYPSAKAVYYTNYLQNFYNKNELNNLLENKSYNRIFRKDMYPPYYFIDTSFESSYDFKIGDIWICKMEQRDNRYPYLAGEYQIPEKIFILQNITNSNNKNYYKWIGIPILTMKTSYPLDIANIKIKFLSELGYIPTSPVSVGDYFWHSSDTSSLKICSKISEPIQISIYNEVYYQYNLTWNQIPFYYQMENFLNGTENISNKVTSFSAQSTDTQYPSAKAVYEKTKLLLLNENYDNSLNKIVISSNTITYKTLYEYALDHMGFITIDSSETVYKHYYFTSAIFDNDTYEINFYNISNGQQYVFHGTGSENDFISITQYDEHNFT